MIVGVGIDVVDLDRFERTLERTPSLRERLFTSAERDLPVASLAARFAAKEATIKAFGGPVGTWHDAWIERSESGQPILQFAGEVAAHADSLGVVNRQVSLSHDGGVATAVVILESAP